MFPATCFEWDLRSVAQGAGARLVNVGVKRRGSSHGQGGYLHHQTPEPLNPMPTEGFCLLVFPQSVAP